MGQLIQLVRLPARKTHSTKTAPVPSNLTTDKTPAKTLHALPRKDTFKMLTSVTSAIAKQNDTNPRTLKNRRRRQRQRQHRVLEAGHSKLETGHSQQQHKPERAFDTIVSAIMILCGIIITATGLAIVAINAWNQSDVDINKWLSVSRDMTCEVVLLVALAVAAINWRKGRYVAAIIAGLIWIGLGYMTIMNNLTWTHTTATEHTRSKELQLEERLMSRPDIVSLRQGWEDLRKDKERLEIEGKQACGQIQGGTKCNRYEKLVLTAAAKVEAAKQAYDQALTTAKATAIAETSPIGNTQVIWFRTFLPLLGGVFLMLGRR